MCIAFFAYKATPGLTLVLAFNRDEYLDRPTLPLAFWEDSPDILAGRDAARKGTWLGTSRNGRFACLTNFTKGIPKSSKRSRGELPTKFLQGTASPMEFLKGLDLTDYAPFTLLVGDFGGDKPVLAYLCSETEQGPVELAPGVYGMSTGELMNDWPKTQQGKEALIEVLKGPGGSAEPCSVPWSKIFEEVLGKQHEYDADALPDTGLGLKLGSLPWSRIFSEVLGSQDEYDDDSLPDTGLGLKLERTFSAIDIQPFEPPASMKGVGRLFGTRSKTIVAITMKGHVEVRERSIPLCGRADRPWDEKRESFTIGCTLQRPRASTSASMP